MRASQKLSKKDHIIIIGMVCLPQNNSKHKDDRSYADYTAIQQSVT